MIASTPSAEKPSIRVESHVELFDAALPPAVIGWFKALETNHEGVRFSVRPTFSSSSLPGVNGREKREREFLVGRRCASELLREFGIHRPVTIHHDRSPAWPAGSVGSISHSDRWTFASVALADDARSLGVDTEPFMTPETVQLIASDVATPRETQLVKDQDFDDSAALTLIFSAKESFYKCWYPITKRFLEFNDVEVFEATRSSLKLRRVEESPSEDSTLSVRYHQSGDDVFTFTILESGQ